MKRRKQNRNNQGNTPQLPLGPGLPRGVYMEEDFDESMCPLAPRPAHMPLKSFASSPDLNNSQDFPDSVCGIFWEDQF